MKKSQRRGMAKRFGLKADVRCGLWVIALVFMASGCASPMPSRAPADPVQTWFDALVPGATSKEDVLLKLGLPSAQFEGERILTYRMAFEPSQGLKSVSREADLSDPRFLRWLTAEYNLVLVFDPTHRLAKKSLVRIK